MRDYVSMHGQVRSQSKRMTHLVLVVVVNVATLERLCNWCRLINKELKNWRRQLDQENLSKGHGYTSSNLCEQHKVFETAVGQNDNYWQLLTRK